MTVNIGRLREWYELLARASNEALVVENRLRRLTDVPLAFIGSARRSGR
jgi:hypothetical protein